MDPASPSDESGGLLTLEQLQETALAHNPSLARASALVESLRGRWLQAGLLPNPMIGYIGEEMGVEGSAGQQGGFVSQRFARYAKRSLDQAVVCAEITRAEQDWASQYQRVLTDVRIAYYDVLIADRRVQVVEDLVQLSEKAVKASQDLLQAAEISRVALLQAEVEVEQANITNQLAVNNRIAAWRRLAAVLGTPDVPPQQLAGKLDESLSEIRWEVALDRVLHESPQVASAMAELERAEWALQRACIEPRPDVQVMVAVQHGDITDDTLGTVEIGIPLPLFDRNQGTIRETRAAVTAAEENVRRLELDLEQRLADAYRRYTDSRYQAQKYSNTILPKAKQTLDLVERGYRQGELDYLTLLTAQRTYFQTHLAYVDSLREFRSAMAEIEGLLLKDSLRTEP